MTSNIYRVGDFVYYESFPSTPYQIRRIDELVKTSNSQIEAKVTCFYRRRDLPVSLLKIADQAEHQNQILGRPRRCLLSRHPLATPNSDGYTEEMDGSTSAANVPNGVSSNGGEVIKRPTEDGNHAKMEVDEKPHASPNEGKDASKSDSSESMKDNSAGTSNVTPVKEKQLERSFGFAGLPQGASEFPMARVHALRQRELFLSRQTESLITSHIRGKCSVEILSEVATCDMYLDNEDSFFYSLVYDPSNQTLLADKGKIEIGERHQAVVPEWKGLPALLSTDESQKLNNGHDNDDENKENGTLKVVENDDDAMDSEENGGVKAEPTLAIVAKPRPKTFDDIPVTDREFLVYHPHHSLTDVDIDRFLIIARAVGTFSRALDSASTVKLPSLHITASAASRDVTLLHAMALLHQANYDISEAIKSLVLFPGENNYPNDVDELIGHKTVSHCGPILCRDQLEEWSAAEATLFEEAMEKYGKDFHDIRADCLPWKSIRDIVEYYYMWKTTGRYTEMQKNKMAEKEKQLKQVFVPHYNKISPNLIPPQNNIKEMIKSNTPCESCKKIESLQWYNWGPTQMHMRLCNDCWMGWRKRGGLKYEHEYENYDLDGIGETSIQQQSPQQSMQQQNAAGNLRNTNSRSGHNRGAIPAASVTGVPRANANSSPQKTVGLQNAQSLHARQAGVGSNFAQQAAALAAAANSQYLSSTRARVTFYLNTTLQARIARRMAPKSILNMRKAARSPFRLIDSRSIQSYFHSRHIGEVMRVARQLRRGRLTQAVVEALIRSHKLGSTGNASFNC